MGACPALPGHFCPQFTGSPQLCAAGELCPDGRVVLACPEGFVCGPGTVFVSSQEACPAGSVCGVGTSVPLPAPAGRYSIKGEGGTTYRICAPGTYCPGGCATVFGEGCSVTVRSPLDGSTLRGGFCPPGTWCPPAIGTPVPCEVGTWSNVTGRTNPCEECPVGRFNPFAGGSSFAACVACPSGFTTRRAGSTSRGACISTFNCPEGMGAVRFPATSIADCASVACSAGLDQRVIPIADGADQVLCAGCPAGFAGKPGACVPCNASMGDVCPGLLSAPLPTITQLKAALTEALAASGLLSGGSSGGSSGGVESWGYAAAAAAGLGASTAADADAAGLVDADGAARALEVDAMTPAAVTSTKQAGVWAAAEAHVLQVMQDASLARALQVALPSPSPATGALPPGCVQLAAVAARYGRAVKASGSAGSDAGGGDDGSTTNSLTWTGGYTGIVSTAGALLLGILLWSFFALRQAPPPPPQVPEAGPPRCCCPGGCTARSALLSVDLFGVKHLVPPYASPRRVRTPFGGCCTLLAVLLIASYWAVLITQRQSNPYLMTRNVAGLSQEQLQLPVQAGGGVSSTGLKGIHVLVTAAGESGACAAVNWTASGLVAGQFSLASSATCGAVSQHAFVCPGCVVQGSSLLSLSLHWSCQALLMEAYSVSPEGVVTSVARAATASAEETSVVAASSGSASGSGSISSEATVQLLSYVQWEPQPMLLLRTDATTATVNRTRGYALLGGGYKARLTTVQADGFLPQSLSMSVAVVLAPTSIYSEAVVTERVPFSQLAASLLGVLGLIGVVALAFRLAEKPLMRCCKLPHAGIIIEPVDPPSSARRQGSRKGKGKEKLGEGAGKDARVASTATATATAMATSGNTA